MKLKVKSTQILAKFKIQFIIPIATFLVPY